MWAVSSCDVWIEKLHTPSLWASPSQRDSADVLSGDSTSSEWNSWQHHLVEPVRDPSDTLSAWLSTLERLFAQPSVSNRFHPFPCIFARRAGYSFRNFQRLSTPSSLFAFLAGVLQTKRYLALRCHVFLFVKAGKDGFMMFHVHSVSHLRNAETLKLSHDTVTHACADVPTLTIIKHH